jgi:hypothetical protein
LNGRRLYRSEDRQAPTLEMAAEAVIPPLRHRGYPLEDELHAIVMRALAKDPTQRFPSAAEMRAELETYVRESSLFASPLKFGQWLTEHFAEEILARRRAREVAAKAIAAGPLVKLTVSQPPPPVALPAASALPVASTESANAGGPAPRGASDPTNLALGFHSAVSRPPPLAWFAAAAALLLMLVVIALLSR